MEGSWDGGDPYGLRSYRIIMAFLGVASLAMGALGILRGSDTVWPWIIAAFVAWTAALGTERVVSRARRRRAARATMHRS